MDDPENREGDHGVEDMINLSVLDESVILRNIRIRYERELIYTFTGSILVSVNPYKMFNIYGLDMVKKYQGRALGSMPPHLFAIGSASYGKMMKDTENQVLVISGESGAGKTEATKLIMQYLAAVNKSGNNLITEQILEANPLLESFGNAKTIRNDNSSRFGKYIEVFFKNGSIVGARTLEYLLEKSRMVTQAQDERNYHVFYEMLEGMSTEQKSKFGLQNAGKYFYLNQGGNCKISSRDDGENFRALSAALDILSFERSEQDTIFKILASVLHIGNIYFKKIHDEATHDTVVLGSDAEIKWISHLLQLSEDWLKQALTTKVTETRGDRVLTPYTIDQALDSRDAIAKALYSRLFTWLVERINNIICRAERDSNTSLAVLDIFGFEDFHTNSFEQLCINYANETMQFFFNQHIFRLEQKEYSKEGIDWSTIEFRDNQPVIDLLASKPAGILCILDDECSFPQATDMSFLEKCHFHHDSNKLYEKPRMSDPVFYVQHYAGRIKYNVDHFLEKNKDTLKSDVVELLCESKSRIIAQMFKDMRDRLITKTLSKSTGRYVTLKPRTPTVSAGFTESLLSLIDNMSKCNPFFVRCIKPNNHKAPMVFETKVVLDQLRYTGMLETIRIRKMGFPVRIKFPVFISRYHCLLHGQDINSKELPNTVCQKIMNTQGAVYKDLYRIGATKVFMKESLEQVLDTEAKKIQDEAIVRIQKCTRMFLARKKFLLAKTSIHNLQRAIRRYSARKKFLVVRNGIIKAQAQFRMFRQHKKYLKTREELKRKLEQERLLRQKQEEEAKMERERQARQEREIASITNLDIPGELAFVYNKLDDWQSINNDRHIVTVNREVQQMDQHYKLPEDINAFAFSKFTSVFFKDPNWGFTLTPIKSPLTQGITGEEMNQIAVAVFKLILRLMYDRNLRDRQEKAMVDYIIQMGLQHEGLRDEIYSQIANQCWNNQNPGVLERAWNLMAACLSAFPPSKRLCKYLIKFVSDIGLEGHQQLCQHKALQCANIEPQFSRIYPPCLLEWRAIQQKANMALEAKFPDGHKMIGHVESWTNAELFARHLLNIRGLQENSYGWTVQVEEEVDYYEIMGYDYVLDLVSEMEIPPGFPYCRSYYLASSDRTREPPAMRRGLYKNSPHSVDDERYMKLAGSLPQPLEVKHSRIESRSFTPRKNYVEENDDGIEFSMTSVLNQRPTELMMDSLSGSKLNMRYTKRKAPSPPTTNGHGVGNGIPNGHITPIVEDMEEVGLDPKSKLNTRYVNGVHTNGAGTPRSVTDEDLSPHSKLNYRYVKSGVIIKERDRIRRHGAGIGMSRKQYQDRYLEGISAASDISAATGQSDWSHWVEDVFNNALNEHVDTLSDAHTLENRLKGGGKGVPGPGIQPAPVPPATLPLLNFGLPANNNVMPTSPPVVPVNDPLQMAAHQMAQQTQQQALYNAYLQQMANLQVQAQAQAQMQQQRQQQQNLMQSAQQQMLQQQFLQMQQQQQQTPQNLVSPASSFNSVGPFPMVIPRDQQQQINGGVGMASAAQPVVLNVQGSQINSQPGMHIPISSVTTEVNSTGAPKKVYKMRSQFEGHTEHKTFAPETSTVPTQQALTVNTENSERKESNVRMVPAPAPPPPPQYQDKELVTPRMQSVPPPPPPPPPPPVMQTMEDTFDREKGMFTFTDKQGRARTVRIGKVVWPPPSFEEEKRTREVGRLEIDENVKQNLHERFSPMKQWKKPESPKEEQKERKSKSLAESVHLATLQLLEQKLGGNKEKETNENKEIYATKIIQDLGPPPPVPPKPSEPVKPPEPVKRAEPNIPRKPAPKPIKTEPEPKNLKKTEEDEEEQAEPPPLPKTAPPPLPPPTQAMETVTMKKKEPQFLINYNELEKVVTRLYPQGKQKYLSYHNVPWTLNLRKEVFHPRERLENPMALHLVFCQVVQDVYNGGCVRINKEDRIKMRGMLESYGINKDNYLGGNFKNQVKKIVVDTAKEWSTYFAKLFPVAGQGHYGGIRYVGVNHNGINFLTRERSLVEDYLDVQEHHHFEDVIDVVLPTRDTIQINLKNKSVVLFTNRASQLKEMIDLYLQESDKGNKYVMAVKDYITRESTLLSFRRNEIIKLLDPEMALEEGWLYGSLNGMLGYFPAEYVRPLARHEVERSGGMKAQLTEHTIQRMIRPPSRDGYADNRSETSQGTAVQDGKFSMMEFALLHFRESVQNNRRDLVKYKPGNADWTWREQAELVKWTRSPIQASLLKLQQAELNKLALECFLCIMKFMGDYPMGSSQNEVDCALKLLKTCHKYPELRDEVYCQMCKQTTSNRSMKSKSCIMGWRLFAIVACYCDCTEALRPYLFKYLENTASDPTRTYSGAASICLQNLRKTFKYGGRKNVPLQEEVQALANGRISKRFPFIYSGCEKEGMVQIKPCTVVRDAVEEICVRLNINDSVEMEEYTLFLRTKDDMMGTPVFSRLKPEEYVLDVTADLHRNNLGYDLVFQRTVWYYPLRSTDNVVYTELMFFQSLPDYIEGLVVVLKDGLLSHRDEEDIATLGALLHRGYDRVGMPTTKDLPYLIPETVRKMPDYQQQRWLNRIHAKMQDVKRRSPLNCKAKFVDILSRWPLFGSTFFSIRNPPTQPVIKGECILAVNKHGIHFLSLDTHVTILTYSFSEVLSTRRYRSDNGDNYLDMKLGDLMVQKIVRIETNQGSDISNLIGQYMQVINRHKKRPNDKMSLQRYH